MSKVLVFSASNNFKSINLEVAVYASYYLQKCSTSIIGFSNYVAPIYSTDIEKSTGIPSSITELHSLFKEADGFIIGCPEHNGTFPALLKNTIDWLSRIEKKVFMQKPVLLLTASPGGRGALSVNEQLQTLLPRWGASSCFAVSVPNYTGELSAADYFKANEPVFNNLALAVSGFEKVVGG